MKKEIIKKLQKTLEAVSINSVGKSFPIGVYEREIPKAVLKKHEVEVEKK